MNQVNQIKANKLPVNAETSTIKLIKSLFSTTPVILSESSLDSFYISL